MASKRWKTVQEFMNYPENKEIKEKAKWRVEAYIANLDRLHVTEIQGLTCGMMNEKYKTSDFISAYNPMLSDGFFVSSIPFN